MTIFVTSDADTTIAVNNPFGDWLCNDDMDAFNPGVVIQSPIGGQYDIWVGTFDPGEQPAATLRFSEFNPF